MLIENTTAAGATAAGASAGTEIAPARPITAELLDRVARSRTLEALLERLAAACEAAGETSDASRRGRSTRRGEAAPTVAGVPRLRVTGLAGSALALVVAHTFRRLHRTILVVLGERGRGEAVRDDLECFLGGEAVLYLPDFESQPYDIRSPHLSTLDARQTALSRLIAARPAVVVTTARSLLTPVPSPRVLGRGVMTVRVGDALDADDLADWLAGLAYRGVPLAEEPGDFARRGGILDDFSFGYASPLRLEFDDEGVISIREYDPTTQRSVRRHEHVTLVPRRELVVDDAVAEAAAAAVRAARGPDALDAEALATRIENERYWIGMRRISGFFDQEWGPVTRYLPDTTLVVADGPDRLEREAATLGTELERDFDDRRAHHELVSPPSDLVLPPETIARDLAARGGFDVDPVLRSRTAESAAIERGLERLLASGRDDAGAAQEADGAPPEPASAASPDASPDAPPDASPDAPTDASPAAPADIPADAPAATRPDSRAGPPPAGRSTDDGVFHFHTVAQEPFGRSFERLRAFLRTQATAGHRTIILCDNPGQRDRLRELIAEGDGTDEAALAAGPAADAAAAAGLAEVEVGQLAGGFVWREVRLAVLTDHEIFARFRRRRTRRRFKAGIALPSLTSLHAGEYVVHIDHGIGVYRGIRRLTIDGHETDCLEVHYQRGDKLFIPVDQFDLIQKYAMEEGKRAPSLSRIGGTAWARTKARARKAIEDMSQELLKLQAMRASRTGIAFEPDNLWQRQLESSFLYDDTPDQARATQDIKRDMEEPKPMDRLICGDVGFGKTEVAVRAAFKAVQSGKQVAVLVPTTILASQHLATFSERLGDFPVRVEMLSRFRTAAEQRDVAAALRTGEVDIVIGTHRLLQKDIEFKELGLIVVDEEQRFGVRHKERLKQLKALADVLTLTATPIPRTLHLALLGARDISLITTPPRDRVPVATEIVEFDRDLIADALLREVDRGGQAFFVHNRVQSIDAIARFLRQICPQLRFAIAHGQMRERALEKVIVDFIDGRYDVLITTMIIESGIDMPSVNTMIINRADRFGLAQLYQLRGRVGRSDQRAHCYLMVPPHRALTELAEKRLRAIEEYDELGAGIKVAMKDLEIRGAGNLLGSEQHGHIVAVGYELYCRLLEETVNGLRGEASEQVETRVSTDLDAYLPDEYVAPAEKIDLYKRLADTREEAQIDELLDELTDRYGHPGEAARNLFELRRVKLLAGKAGLAEVDVGRRRVRIEFARQPTTLLVGAILERTARKVEFVQGERFGMKVTEVGDDPLGVALEMLAVLRDAAEPVAGPAT
ncbi:MAG: transcription-repair coupling factor [Candidatus Eiseniibacteriota bacterium]|jgi:transcription-repair coupling factor (superfamily II helicase)